SVAAPTAAVLLYCRVRLYYQTFFFEEEDGIRIGHVTGVQTCALPISVVNPKPPAPAAPRRRRGSSPRCWGWTRPRWRGPRSTPRTEERRVGKEGRWGAAA